MFETLDAEIAARARLAAQSAAQSARLTKQLQRAAELADLHALRQRCADAAGRAAEAAAVALALREAVDAYRLGAGAGQEAAAELPHAGYAAAFEQACASEGVPLEGAYPDYRVFPFEVRLRLAEERALIGRRSWWALRPAALARAVRAERERLLGGPFAAERFGAALVRAYRVLLPEVRQEHGAGAHRVPLRDVLALLQLGAFGRSTYTRDQFAFDLYRFRQTEMSAAGQRVLFGDMRGGGAGIDIPTARGGHERLIAIQAVPGDGAVGTDGV